MLVLVGLLVLVTTAPLMACPTCKQALAENGQSQDGLVRGYFWSILFMMSMPFMIFCGLGFYFSWQVRRARQHQVVALAGGMTLEATSLDPRLSGISTGPAELSSGRQA
tara:strand:+ start:173 stop:499 length:327 start_codon:yes stop_codon:yes gene_type:complete